MGLLRPELWGAWLGVAFLLLSNSTARTPPYFISNRLSLGALGAGLIASLLVTLPLGLPTQQGSLGASLAAVVTAFLLLFWAWLMGGLSSGTIKMQMAYAAWVGCSLDPQRAVGLVAASTVLFVALFFAYAYAYTLWKRWKRPDDNNRLLAAQPWTTAGAVCAILLGVSMGLL